MNECIVCKSPGAENHHIIKGRGKRRQLEDEYNQVPLCYACHRGTYGVHGREGAEMDLQLKLFYTHVLVLEGYEIEEIRAKMGGKMYFKQKGEIQWKNTQKTRQ